MSRPPPLLLDALDSFPAPPTFIPQHSPAFPPSPHFFNPPPSRPPTAPLPPVPGPSRLSDADTLLFLSSAAPARSRSKASLREHRDSVASTRSSTSTRSPQTPSSAAQSLHRPSLAFSIDENQQDDLLDGAPLLKAPLDDTLDLSDLSVPVPPLASARRTPPRIHTPRRESIALTSVSIPAQDSDTEPDFDALDAQPETATDERAPSPDIATIIAATPRPRVTALTRRPPDEEPWEDDLIDDYGEVRRSGSIDLTFGFPDADESVNSDDGHRIFEEPVSDADSDLDLHTSLPQLMLHHGFLSPRSKLLPHSPASLAPSPAPSPGPSPASAVFPSTERPLPRDTRDTPKRRVRHRDGKLLRGGIGLTTGLGWSDSEDEDAPSALTRRISSLNLNRSESQLGLNRSRSTSLSTRASTFSSARTSTFSSSRTSTASSPARTSIVSSSARSSAYSRSTSRARRVQSEHEQTDTDVDEFGAWQQPHKSAAPPTSWTRRSDPTSRLSRAQSQTGIGRMPSIRSDDSSHTTHTTASATTSTSAMSLPLMRTRSRVLRDDSKPLPRTPSLRRTPTAANTIIRAESRSGIRPRAATGVSGLPGVRGLPGVSGVPQPHSRVPLSMQSTPHAGLPASSSSSAVPPMPGATKPQMRPLRLQPRMPVLGGDRAPVPVPEISRGLSPSVTASSLASSASSASTDMLSVSTSATSMSLLSPSSSVNGGSLLASPSSPQEISFVRAPSPYSRGPPSPAFAPTPTTPRYDAQGLDVARPRPRTGTGMVYRTTSTYGGAGPGRLPVRAPNKVVAL
ncbi:hypothetical protein C8R47DRAFT_1070168 [Mycena vitilis]|nr:hypothetical protein C8R47DRAFT_1070168 [Mycena vitilis]